jgi:hypothetical protein
MQPAGHHCASLCYLPTVSANCYLVLFVFNGACMRSVDVLKLLQRERRDTLWVSYGVPCTDTWQYCLSGTMDIINICLFNDPVGRLTCSHDGQLGVN